MLWNAKLWQFLTFIAALILTSFGGSVKSVLQQVTIEADKRNETFENTRNFSIPKSESLTGNFPNLSEVSLIALEGKIKSICVQAGLWALFYSENYLNIGAILYTSGRPDDRACTNPDTQTEKFKSVRHIGNRQLSQTGISFYAGSFFTREELYFDGFKLQLSAPFQIRSFGFTGKDNWTVFSETDFSGHNSCLLSAFPGGDQVYDAVVYNKDVTLTLGSLRRGCGPRSPDDLSRSTVFLPTGEVADYEDATPLPSEAPSTDSFQLNEVQTNGGMEKLRSIFTDGDELRLPETFTLTAKYVIVDGSNWTVFSDTNFEEGGRCFQPQKLKAGAENETIEATQAVALEIGSIKRGCFPGSSREPRVLNLPKTLTNQEPPKKPSYSDDGFGSPSHRIFFTSFLMALGILVLLILIAIFTITCLYIRRKKR